MMNLIRDLPKGPLDLYRKQATFNWKTLKLNLFGEDLIKFQEDLYQYLETTSEFRRPEKSLSLNETRRECYKQLNLLVGNNIANVEPKGFFNYLFFYKPELGILIGLQQGMVNRTLMLLGTGRHSEILKNMLEGKFTGCFSLTEIAHGTNVQGMQTTAKYDPKSESFIFHSSDFESAKCWAASLGKVATHAIVYAQLITADNENHGLQPFIVQIRDPETFLPMPGLTVGDMGEKIGLNGLDNGFLIFNHYSVPRINLLNKNVDVTKEGKFVSKMKGPSKLFGASLGVLSGGRINITSMSLKYLTLAIVISIRYAAVRKQFGPSSKDDEWPIIEYQALQGRLFPYLATTYALTMLSQHCIELWDEFNACMFNSEDKQLIDASRLGDLRADNDANCTYEGENTVLIQQTSNWLISQWKNISQGADILSPFETIYFLKDANKILLSRFTCCTVDQTMQLENLLLAFRWLLCYYLKNTCEKVQRFETSGNSKFEVKNNSQAYLAKALSLIYAEHFVIQTCNKRITGSNFRNEERIVLTKLLSLYAAWSLEKRLADLYAGGFASSDSKIDILLREGIISESKDLLKDAVSLVDVLAPSDFILNSPLGMSDGEVYKHLQKSIFENPENFERPSWWKEISRSKL